MTHYTWSRRGGYECSSKGDKRFSALHAVLPDGRTIEQHYQCDIKGYQPGGKDWRLGKGKPPLNPNRDLWSAYLILWTIWAAMPGHYELLLKLKEEADKHAGVLTDCFASTPINQARALAELLNFIETTHAP
jgi:hypothetical protein